jgi:transcriptional regulator with XRE-family HTH domain
MYLPETMPESAMKPSEFKEARHQLGLSVNQIANMLGLDADHVRRMEFPEESKQRRPVMENTRRLLQAYLDGYRPPDWPKEHRLPRRPVQRQSQT